MMENYFFGIIRKIFWKKKKYLSQELMIFALHRMDNC